MHVIFYYIVALLVLVIWSYLALKRNGIVDRNEFLLFLFGEILWVGFAEMMLSGHQLTEHTFDLLVYSILAVAGVNLANNITNLIKRK